MKEFLQNISSRAYTSIISIGNLAPVGQFSPAMPHLDLMLPLPSIQNDFLTFFSTCEAYQHQSIALWQISHASDHLGVYHSLHTDLSLLISCFSYRIERDICIHCHIAYVIPSIRYVTFSLLL